MGFQPQSTLRSKEPDQVGSQGMARMPAGQQLVKIHKRFLDSRVNGTKLDARALERNDATGSQDFQGEIQSQGIGVEQIQRPEVEGTSGKVGAAGSLCGDDLGCREGRRFAHAELYHAGNLGA